MAEMNYCGPHGVGWLEFLSWPKVSRDAAILWQQHRAEVCTGCGTHPDEWNPARGGRPDAFEMGPTHCRGCEVRAQAEEQFERDRKRYRRGTTMVMRRPKGDPE